MASDLQRPHKSTHNVIVRKTVYSKQIVILETAYDSNKDNKEMGESKHAVYLNVRN